MISIKIDRGLYKKLKRLKEKHNLRSINAVIKMLLALYDIIDRDYHKRLRELALTLEKVSDILADELSFLKPLIGEKSRREEKLPPYLVGKVEEIVPPNPQKKVVEESPPKMHEGVVPPNSLKEVVPPKEVKKVVKNGKEEIGLAGYIKEPEEGEKYTGIRDEILKEIRERILRTADSRVKDALTILYDTIDISVPLFCRKAEEMKEYIDDELYSLILQLCGKKRGG